MIEVNVVAHVLTRTTIDAHNMNVWMEEIPPNFVPLMIHNLNL